MKLNRLLLQAFEIAFSLLFIVSGSLTLTGLSTPEPLEILLPVWLYYLMSSCYLIAGTSMFVGVLWPRGDIEGAGLALLIPLLTGRAILFGQLLGWGLDAIVSLTFSVVFSLACAARIYLIARLQE